jgi:iron complex outermembrane receptor protein
MLNLKAGIDVKNAELSIWARNTGNKKYIGYAYDFGAVYLGNPRVVGMSIEVKL